MAEKYVLELEWADVMQVLDALETRAASWENTLSYARGEEVDSDSGIIEEYKDATEAEAIATHFRDIIRKIETQVKSD